MIVTTPSRLPILLRRRRWAVATVCAALLVAGCTATEAPPASNAPSPAAPAPTTEPDEDTGGADAEAPRDFASEPLDACIVGTWALNDAQWREGIELLVSLDLDDVAVASSGALTLELEAEQGYTVSADAFTTITTGGSTGGDLRWTLAFDGPETGTWYVLSEILILDRDAGRQMVTTNVAELDGQLIDGSPTDPDSTPWSDDLGITCDATTLVASPLNEPGAFPLEFTRQS